MSVFHHFERWVDPFPRSTSNAFPATAWRFLWNCVEGARPGLVALAACTAGVGILEALLYRLLAHLVDDLAAARASGASESGIALVLLLLGLVLIGAMGLVAVQAGLKYQVITASLVARVRWRFHRALLEKRLAFFTADVAGRLATTVMQCAVSVRIVWIVLADILVFVVIYFAALTTLAGALNPLMLLPFLAWVLLYGFALHQFVPRLGQAGQGQAGARAQVAGYIADAYTHANTVKVFSSTDQELSQARRPMKVLLAQSKRQLRLVSGFEFTNQLLSALLIFSTAGLSTWLWSEGKVGTGAVAATIATAIRLHGIAQFVMTQMTLLFDNLGVIQDGAAILGDSSPQNDSTPTAVIHVSGGEIQFDNVHFGYAPGQRVFRGLSFHVRAGERVGIVGVSGAGKSTLVNLLLGLYEPAEGHILIDSQNIKTVCGQSLRDQIALVSQDTALLNRSVAANIALGRPETRLSDIERAAAAAGVDLFIETLSDVWGNRGYDAIVGDRGMTLSGGQRQRIAIARALLRDCPILVMDEPTSSLDAQTEAHVQKHLVDHMVGKTVLAISHRLANLQLMDRILVLQDGHIVEAGSHDQLLARCGVYADLWSGQNPAPA